jgi:methylthioribulose-1-phosphate dehydratase
MSPSAPPFDPASGPVDQLRAIGREFHARAWSLGTSSNYSVVASRQPLELLITASGKDKSALGPDDFVRVDKAGRVVDGSDRRSSAETLLHCLVAELVPSLGGLPVGAILHTHSVWSTVLSGADLDRGSLRIEGYEMLKGLEGIGTHETVSEVPIFANAQDRTLRSDPHAVHGGRLERPETSAFSRLPALASRPLHLGPRSRRGPAAHRDP